MKEANSDVTQGMRKEVGGCRKWPRCGGGGGSHVHQVKDVRYHPRRSGRSLDNYLEGTEMKEELGR